MYNMVVVLYSETGVVLEETFPVMLYLPYLQRTSCKHVYVVVVLNWDTSAVTGIHVSCNLGPDKGYNFGAYVTDFQFFFSQICFLCYCKYETKNNCLFWWPVREEPRI